MAQSENIAELRSKFEAKLSSEGVPDPPKEFHPNDLERIKDDVYLKRFLDHNEGDINMAVQMMWDTLIWRKTFGTNEINETNINMEFVNEGAFFPRGRDIDGRLMLIFRCSKHFKGRKDLEEIKRCIVYWFERVERQERGKPITLFFDMEGCGLSNMDMEFTKYLIGLFKFYYPYFLNYIIIYEMPWLLSAPFKVIKQLLPAKAVSKMKFLSLSNIKDFVPLEQALSCWGGKDDYEFKFEPEIKNGTQTDVTKKVTFAATEDKNTKTGELLTLTPHDFIVFSKDGIDVTGTFTILNDGDKIVSFKIRTTSPEKFRVRPSTGVLKPGQSQTIVIVVQTGYKLNIVSKDRFLVMCVPISDVGLSTQQLTEVWQGSSSSTIEEYRLKCSFPEGESNKQNNVKDMSPSNGKDYDNLKKRVDYLQECNNKLHSDMRFIKILQISLMVVSSLALFFVYMIYDIQKDNSQYSKNS